MANFNGMAALETPEFMASKLDESGRRAHTTTTRSVFHMAKARGQVREAFRTRDMRIAARQHGPRPRALRHEGRRRARGGGAAVLRERAVRHRPRAQRQPHEHARAHRGPVPRSTAGTSTPRATPRCCVNVLATELQAQITRPRPRPRPGVRRRSSCVHERVEGSYAVDRAHRRATACSRSATRSASAR